MRCCCSKAGCSGVQEYWLDRSHRYQSDQQACVSDCVFLLPPVGWRCFTVRLSRLNLVMHAASPLYVLLRSSLPADRPWVSAMISSIQ